MQAQPESDSSTNEERSDNDEDFDSADDPFEPEVQNHQVLEPEERVLRERNKIKRPSRNESGINPDSIFLLEVEEPQNYQEAITSPYAVQWKRAMDEEIESLKKNNTWSIVDQQDGGKLVQNRWVYKLKRKPDGSIDKFKARLVTKGYSQRQGIDYHETFSPVVKFDSIRVILAMAAARNMVLHQFDIKTAFLNEKLQETIYMDQPEGYRNVCKLERCLYGLKQASRCWHERFTLFLKKFNLKRNRTHASLITIVKRTN